MLAFRDCALTNRTAENGPFGMECGIALAFLRKAHSQSGFKKGIRRMECDQKPEIRALRIDFSRHIKDTVLALPQGFFWPTGKQ
jgi:hypothetical protein